MAESGSMLDAFLQWLGPRTAEATIVGGPAEQQLVQDLSTQNAQQQGQYLHDMYQRILTQAHGHPQSVRLQAAPGFSAATGATAEYLPRSQAVLYDPKLPRAGLANTIPHELLHFLNAQTSNQEVATQHALMKKLIGTDVYKPPEVLQGYQPGALSPVEHSIVNEWLGGPRDWPR